MGRRIPLERRERPARGALNMDRRVMPEGSPRLFASAPAIPDLIRACVRGSNLLLTSLDVRFRCATGLLRGAVLWLGGLGAGGITTNALTVLRSLFARLALRLVGCLVRLLVLRGRVRGVRGILLV